MPLYRRILLTVFAVAALSGTAIALIERLTPLAGVIEDADLIFLAKIEKVDPEKPSLIMNVETDLKGKAEFRRLPVNLTGDKEKHTPDLLARVAADLPVIVFVTELNKKQLALVYTEGTWFQVIGTPDGNNVRWAFTHGEPFLRRTFKGATAELIATVKDVLAGKAKAPAPNSKEPPGFGPKISEQAK